MGKIVVVGSSNTDLVVSSTKLPSPGETVLGGEFDLIAGGKGANQAVAAARAGSDVMFIAKIGNDYFRPLDPAFTLIHHFECSVTDLNI